MTDQPAATSTELTRPLSSLEKIELFADELRAPPGPDAEPLDLAMRSLVTMAYPQFKQLLPDDPAVLDQALEAIAEQLLGMRSDGARVVQLADHDGTPLELAAGE